MTTYLRDGYYGGHIIEESEDDYFDYLQSHHDCSICGDKNVSEELLYRTSMGWMHIDCYNEIIINAAEDGSEIPELL